MQTKKTTLAVILGALIVLAACGQSEPITLVEDADQPFLGGKSAPTVVPRPEPRPERRDDRNADCRWKHVSQDCDPERIPREVECTMLLKPGTMIATREKECAALA